MKKYIYIMCMKEGEEENELKENKQIKYLSKHCLFGRTKHLSFSTGIHIMRSIKPLHNLVSL